VEIVLPHLRDDAKILRILDHIPDSTPINEYQDLMPLFEHGQLKLEWDRDDVNNICNISHNLKDSDFTDRYRKKSHASLSKFYIERTRRIASLLPSYAQELLNLARAKHIPDSELTELRSEVEQICFIVYDTSGSDISLDEFQQLSENGM
jgi:hypothetical protein